MFAAVWEADRTSPLNAASVIHTALLARFEATSTRQNRAVPKRAYPAEFEFEFEVLSTVAVAEAPTDTFAFTLRSPTSFVHTRSLLLLL
jgi:hypothetical protein